MISLAPNEVIILQVDASGSGRHDSFKLKGKGTLFVTSQRIVFRDHKEGTLLNLDYIEELLGYSALKKDRLVIDWQKNGGTGKMEFEVDDAKMLEARIRETQDNARKIVQKQGATQATVTTSHETRDASDITNELVSLLYNYDVDSYRKYNELEDNLEYLKPYIKTKLGNLIHATWPYSHPIELYWLIDRKHAETAYRMVVKFYPDALKDASPDLLDKIATESVRLEFTIDNEKVGKDISYDPLRIKITEIESCLVGLAVTHNDSNFVINPDDYRNNLERPNGPYGYEKNQAEWNELVQVWSQWRYAARRYDVDSAVNAKTKIYEKTKKYHKFKYGTDADRRSYEWLASPERACLELYTAYLEAMVNNGIQPKEQVKPMVLEDEIMSMPAS